MTDLDTRIRTVLGDVFDLDPAEIGAHTSMDSVERWDSLQHITLVLALEEEFGVHFTEDGTVALLSYPLIVAILTERLAASAQR